MIRDGFVSNSSSTTFIVILDEPFPTTFETFRRGFAFLSDTFFESSPADYEPFTRKELYQQIVADANAQQVNDFMRIRRILQWQGDRLPSVVREGELAWYIRGNQRTAFEDEVKRINAKYSVIAIEELNTIMHHESSYTYIFEYSDNVKPYDFNTALEHSDIWDHMPGIVISLSNH
ncbi:MAG: hypothetical protein PHH65_07940 [Eubacteriales bacterium]|nr:hypothetical protein [Eubacteriales bacterium]